MSFEVRKVISILIVLQFVAHLHDSTLHDRVILAVFRPLNSDSLLCDRTDSANSLCIKACHHAIALKELYWSIYPRSDYSFVTMAPLYDCAITLMPMLRNTTVHDLFSRTCHLIREHIKDFPFASLLLQTLLALSMKLDVELPDASLECFEGLSQPGEDLTDVPISYVLPQVMDWRDSKAGDSDDEDEEGVQLGQILTKWNAMSLH